jgi:hypothetical protein
VVEKGVRVGDRARVVNPRALSQVGQSLGNKATDSSGRKLTNPIETFYTGRSAAGKPGGVPLGNEVACNVQGGGPGKGRNLWGQSGSQKQWGAANPGVPGLPSTKGEWPD